MNEPEPNLVPPSHGEPVNVGARVGDYCACGFPTYHGLARCPNCYRPYDNEEDE